MLRSVADPQPTDPGAEQPPSHLRLAGTDFERVCVRRSGVAVYRGDGAYLRIGPGLDAEVAAHRLMLERGFPVPRMMRTGRHGGHPYLIEESLGTTTLGERFMADYKATGRISDEGFGTFLAVAERYARAQATSAVRVARSEPLSRLTGLEDAVALAPDLESPLRDAFAVAEAMVGRLPTAPVHPDLHEHNMCSGGVIDLEDVGWGPAGYDVATAPFVHDLCGLAPAGARWFSERQVSAYLAMVDRVFGNQGLPPVSERLDHLLVCRAIALCAKRHPVPDLWADRQRVLRQVVRGFLAGDRVCSQLRDQA
jgi:hypothetical protein